ncbi:hypothetical protein EY643_10995 [Halioglobus maricola]|uniref:Peptidoglycan-binding protein CsiV n=1 Tax=Halioglobus maricola TaxID=2601894 RepID=A0A5P9NKV5_9GAMM|nr:CsiV family protein [Halioglobus maricola]QFU76145.1 hypothetical protein EY643_10995 [Halioglobus maricola]
MPLAPRPLRTALAALCLLSTTAHANERWYQVELLVFSHETSNSVEQWDPLPELSYPTSGRFLVYPVQVESRLQEFPGESEINEFGRQLIVMPPEVAPDASAQPTDETVTPDTSEAAQTASAEVEAAEQLYPTPFVALPHRQREFHGKSAYMQRTGKYRTLFHESWVQPMQAEGSAVPLVLDASGDIQNWPRLQGTVKLHIARYLHIETNLWLNTSGDYLPGEWRMPAPPLGPASLIVEHPEPSLPEEPEPYYVNQVSFDEPGTADDPNSLSDAAEDLGPVYPWRHAVALQQARRMRSNEVHYIDHPLMGVVIKFTPLDDEELHDMGLAEAEATAAKAAKP